MTSPHDYVRLLEAQAATTRNTFLASLQATGLTVKQCHGEASAGKADVMAELLLKADGLEATVDALISLEKPAVKGQPPYEPHLAIGTHTVAKEDKIKIRIRLAFFGYVLGNGHRHRPPTGVIINIAGDAQRIQLPKMMANLESAIDTLTTWRSNLPPDLPPINLNDHCLICPFKKRCLEQAEKDDNLTLLDRMRPKVMRKYQKKGIFTSNRSP